MPFVCYTVWILCHVKAPCFAGFVAANLAVNLTIPTQSDPAPVMSVFAWIIIHQHLGYAFDWHLRWPAYKAGFGSIEANFWLGLEKVHLLTISQPYRLRVEVEHRSTHLWYSAFWPVPSLTAWGPRSSIGQRISGTRPSDQFPALPLKGRGPASVNASLVLGLLTLSLIHISEPTRPY